MTYSVHKELLWLFTTHIRPHVDLIITTSSWPSLYTCDFMAYFLYLLLVDGIIFTYIMASYAPTSAILYIYLLFMTYSVHREVFGGLHILPCFWLSSTSTNFSWPSLWSIFSLVSLFLHIIWLQVHVPLVTTSVHITPLSELFCRYGTFWRLILYTYFSMFWPILYKYQVFLT